MWLDGNQSAGRDGPGTARDDAEAISKPELRIHRIFDFAAGAIGVILFTPILLVTSIAVKLESRGPVFVRQPALGCNNRMIEAFRFRLVKLDDRGAPRRLTRVGQILCATGIDELPQLFNVLRGEMSINGLLRSTLRDGILRP